MDLIICLSSHLTSHIYFTCRWEQRKIVDLYRHVLSIKENEAQTLQQVDPQQDLAVIPVKFGEYGLIAWFCCCVILVLGIMILIGLLLHEY